MGNCNLESYSSVSFLFPGKRILQLLAYGPHLKMGSGRKLCHLLPICCAGKQQLHNAVSTALLSLLTCLDPPSI